MAIKLEMLKCFRAVAQHGSLAEAASALGRTPSAVSMMLKQFEDHLGAPLFETGRKSRLSPLGLQVQALAIDELEHFDRTIGTIEALSRADMGYVRLSVIPSVAQTFLPSVLKRFVEAHPNVQLSLSDKDTRGVLKDLQSEQADLGLASSGQLQGYPSKKLLSDAFGVICRKDHPLAREWGSLTWRDLSAEGFISNGLCEQITDPDFEPIRSGARLNVRNTSSLLGLVQAGVGYTLLPERVLLPAFSDLTFLPLNDSSARREVWLVLQPSHLLSPAARAMADLIGQASEIDGV